MSLRRAWSWPAMLRTTRFIIHLGESNAGSRQEWIAALDMIESLKPRAVLAGHKRPGRPDAPTIVEETRQYIRDFDRIAANSQTANELDDQMLAIYRDRVNQPCYGI